MQCAVGFCVIVSWDRHLSARMGQYSAYDKARELMQVKEWVMNKKPRLAVVKFASCDGCQLTLLDAEDELLAVCGPGAYRSFCGSLQQSKMARTMLRWSKARSPRPMMLNVSSGCGRFQKTVYDRRLQLQAASKPCATLPITTSFMRCVLCTAAVDRDFGYLHADCPARERRFRVARLPSR